MSTTLFTPVRLLAMVEDTNSDFNDGLNGWLNFWTSFDDEYGTMWLEIEFHDAETDNVHYARFELFADALEVNRYPHP